MPETSSAPRAQQSETSGDGLTHLSLRELLQRLAACEEALRASRPTEPRLSTPQAPAGVRVAGRPVSALPMPGADPPAGTQAVLREQAAISRELQRRRHLRHPRQGAVDRRRSAAWPPPPW